MGASSKTPTFRPSTPSATTYRPLTFRLLDESAASVRDECAERQNGGGWFFEGRRNGQKRRNGGEKMKDERETKRARISHVSQCLSRDERAPACTDAGHTDTDTQTTKERPLNPTT